MRTIDDFMQSLPETRQASIRERSAELIAEQMTLKQFRKAHALTQKKLADRLNIDQARVSKMEQNSDMLLSTLRGYVEAVGGTLDLTVTIGAGTVHILSVGEAAGNVRAPQETAKRKARPKAARVAA